ncbi:hypothetical protein V2J09_014320 [Rumex salicifolius]
MEMKHGISRRGEWLLQKLEMAADNTTELSTRWTDTCVLCHLITLLYTYNFISLRKGIPRAVPSGLRLSGSTSNLISTSWDSEFSTSAALASLKASLKVWKFLVVYGRRRLLKLDQVRSGSA